MPAILQSAKSLLQFIEHFVHSVRLNNCNKVFHVTFLFCLSLYIRATVSRRLHGDASSRPNELFY